MPAAVLFAAVSIEPTPSFDHHPGLRGREPEARAMAEEIRRIIRLSVSTAPPADETASTTAQLADIADRLEAHIPEKPLPRFVVPEEASIAKGAPLGGSMPFDL